MQRPLNSAKRLDALLDINKLLEEREGSASPSNHSLDLKFDDQKNDWSDADSNKKETKIFRNQLEDGDSAI
jgi:hypothetical protein